MAKTAAIITLPGISGSGPDHWQSHWEAREPAIVRFAPSDWDRPDLADWCRALDAAVSATATPPVLVAHSLSCLLMRHAAPALAGRIAGAMLVAPPDPSGPDFPAEAASFAAPPRAPFPFPTLVVASANDPYAATEHVRGEAEACGAAFVEVGALGHINATSGLGAWPEGRRLLTAFMAGLGLRD
ncbi:RBBP9/YdeN family alpha/beta hydrolase [Acuticoccus kandeliae]|uniref:RBBP9/YdeN family alpha/beta hydrolase n=1 Tax=Acuticoccus kandeliae TaxID=2073160 RepID=UPI000D3E51B0|nr:alpha/beta fold hydrolase [Acuticoccus kandeliae]